MPPEMQATIDAMEPAFRARFVAMAEPITSPAQLFLMAKHLMAGDGLAAALVAAAPSDWFAPFDILMAAAYDAGRKG